MATVTVNDAGGMEPLDFIASLVHSLAWPVALVIVVLIFHKQIAALIPETGEFGAFGLNWKRGVRAAKAAIIAAPNQQQVLLRLMDKLPDAMPERIGRIVQEWNEIERWLREKVRAEGLNPSPPVAQLIEAGVRQGVLTADQGQSLRGLYALRSLAVHGREDQIDEGRVLEFMAIAQALKVLLQIPDADG